MVGSPEQPLSLAPGTALPAPLRSLNNATKKVLVERTETLRFSAWKAEAPWDDASLLLIGQQRGSVR